MYLINYYYKLIIKHDLVNKFLYKNINELPKLKKINLNFYYDNKNFNLKNLGLSMLALELITNQKGKLTHLKNPKLSIKIRKGHPVGCKITLEKKSMYEFFFNLLTNILPKIKNFSAVKIKHNHHQVKTVSFKITNISITKELEKHHNLFKGLPKLGITFVTNTKNQKELFFLLVSHKLPLIFIETT
jgi:large subunit ribosomal protein L5